MTDRGLSARRGDSSLKASGSREDPNDERNAPVPLKRRRSWFKLRAKFPFIHRRTTSSTSLPIESSESNVGGSRPLEPPNRAHDPNPVSPTTGGTTSDVSPVSCPRISVTDVDKDKPTEPSNPSADPVVVCEKKKDRGSTTQVASRLLLDLVKEGADGFPPLKSAASALSAVLGYYDQSVANRETIKSLIPRIAGLAKSLGGPAPEGHTKEADRRKTLERKLDEVLQDLKSLEKRGKIEGFLNNAKDAEILTDLVEDIREAMMDYQTALQQDIFEMNNKLINKADMAALKNMYHAADAGFHVAGRNGCLRGTRRDVLSQIEQWLVEGDRRMFWLNGLAGTGKTTIAQTFAEKTFADGELGASFFCSRDFEDRRNLHAIFPTIAFQLAHRYPLFRERLLPILEANADIERGSLCSQLENLIVRPLKEARTPTLIIIDALDECKDKEPASALLSVLSRYVHEIPEVKFFITGRPERQIREGFRSELLQPITVVFQLHGVDRSSVDEDIKLYLKVRLKDIRERRTNWEFPGEWPSPFDIGVLCKKASGLFIYASTVVKFVGSTIHVPTERLTQIIERSARPAYEGVIDDLYTQILELAYRDAGPEEEDFYSRFRTVVGAVLLVFHPLSRKALSELVKEYVAPPYIPTTLDPLHSLLHVPDSEDGTIRVLHKSFPDFLTDPNRCRDKRFFVDLSAYHQNILLSCVGLMKGQLMKNICNLHDYAILGEIEDLPDRRTKHIGGSLEYSCRFWTKHLATTSSSGSHVEQMRGGIDEFFKARLLYWIEVLSIAGHLGVAVYAIDEIRRWCASAGIPTSRQADDSERFILEHFDMIRDSPSHIYHSALPLSPSPWLHKCYEAYTNKEVEVLVGLPEKWDTCSRTISFGGRPTAFARWEDIIAVGLEPDTVALLDAITGNRKSTLSGHTGTPLSLAFSIDGTLLVSGSNNATVQLWDIQTGGVIWALSGHAFPITSISISKDNNTIASGSVDGAVHLWGVRAGKRLPSTIRHGGSVTAINFSPTDPRRFVTSSEDGTVQQWDTDGNQIGMACEGEAEIAHVAYAPDGTRFVFCGGSMVTVRGSESGAVVVQIDGSKQMLNFQYCCFSPDGKFVACAADFNTYIWDITEPEARLVENFVGHTDNVIFLVFSSSLISGSWDQSVKFWQTNSFSSDPVTIDSMPARLLTSEPIESVNVFAEDRTVVTSTSSGEVETWDLETGRRKSSFSVPIEGIRDTHFSGDTLTVVWQGLVDGKRLYHIWDTSGGGVRTVGSTFDEFLDLRISEDGSKIFGLDPWRIEAQSIRAGGDAGGEVVWHKKNVQQGSLVVRGSKVWLAGSGGRGWDFEGSEVGDFPLSKESPLRLRLHFVDRPSHSPQPAWVQDVITERVVFRLPDRYMKPGMKRRWNGRYLIICSPSREVVIMDFEHICSD